MAELDLTKLIIPTEVKNVGDLIPTITTKDYVYLDNLDSISSISSERQAIATDYAIMNGAKTPSLNIIDSLRKNTNQYCGYILSQYKSTFDILTIDKNGQLYYSFASLTQGYCIRPKIRLRLQNIQTANGFLPRIKIQEKIYERDGKHFIQLGEFPNSYVGDELNDELEDMYPFMAFHRYTGKKFGGFIQEDGTLRQNLVYEYEGQKYTRVKTNFSAFFDNFSDGTKINKDKQYLWVKVEPIEWEIINYDAANITLPDAMKGKPDNFLELRTTHGIMAGMSFYPLHKHDYWNFLWQNSTIRAYLNGINVNNITENGNANYSAPNGGDFTYGNFLSQAFNTTSSQLDKNNKELEANYNALKQQKVAEKIKYEQQKRQAKAEEKIDDIFQKALAKYKEDHGMEK